MAHLPESSHVPFQFDFNADTYYSDAWGPSGHTLAEKLKHAIRLDAEQLKILADIIIESNSHIIRTEVIRKVGEEYRELFFWNTLLLVYDTGPMLYEAKA